MHNTPNAPRRQSVLSDVDRVMAALDQGRDTLAAVSALAARTGLMPPAVKTALAELARAGRVTRVLGEHHG